MPMWARVNDNDSSSDDELQADTRYAKECGDKLLHYILYQKYSAKDLNPEKLDRLVCGRTWLRCLRWMHEQRISQANWSSMEYTIED